MAEEKLLAQNDPQFKVPEHPRQIINPFNGLLLNSWYPLVIGQLEIIRELAAEYQTTPLKSKEKAMQDAFNTLTSYKSEWFRELDSRIKDDRQPALRAGTGGA